MDDSYVTDLTIRQEVVSYTLNRGSGCLFLQGKIDDGILQSLFVLKKYISARGHCMAIIVKTFKVAGEDELITETETDIRNFGKMGETTNAVKTYIENQGRKTETHEFSSVTTGQEFPQLRVSKYGFQERFKRVDITLESKKQGALLHVVANTIPTHVEFLSLDICVTASRRTGLLVDLGPLFYSSHGLVKKVVLDCVFCNVYPPTPTTTTSRENRPALVGGGRRGTNAAPLHSSNSGQQNFHGHRNNSGIIEDSGNQSVYIENLILAFGDMGVLR